MMELTYIYVCIDGIIYTYNNIQLTQCMAPDNSQSDGSLATGRQHLQPLVRTAVITVYIYTCTMTLQL